KEILKISQLKENEPIFIVNEKKEGASCITTHLQWRYHRLVKLPPNLKKNQKTFLVTEDRNYSKRI
ncbi:MAG: hypothetical protein E6Y87_17260, partial [Bacteroides caccae]|nr:hypothetical protein [Bacteroides caccae]